MVFISFKITLLAYASLYTFFDKICKSSKSSSRSDEESKHEEGKHEEGKHEEGKHEVEHVSKNYIDERKIKKNFLS